MLARRSCLALLLFAMAVPAHATQAQAAKAEAAPAGVPLDLNTNQTLCDKGNPKACNFVGALYGTGQFGAVTMDQTRATTFFKKACDGGYPTGCANLANQIFNGWGAAMDRPRALQIYQKACDEKVVTACMDLGVIYRDGKGISAKNPALAVPLLQRACDISVAACASIASMYELGIGVPKDVPRAITLYRKSCTAPLSDSADDIQRIWSRASCNVLTRLR
jgi:uncharacterized protein